MPTIAIIGASSDRNKFGNKAVRAYAQRGYEIYPVNPHEPEIEGYKCYRSILDIPVTELDRVSIYLPPHLGMKMIEEIAQKPSQGVWFNPGADSPELLERARGLGLNVVAGCSILDIGIRPDELK